MASFSKRLLQLAMFIHTLIYRLSHGRLLNVGDHIILLTTIGRKSGQMRTVPLYSVHDGDAYVVIGSYGGADAHPAWYHNLQARAHALVTDRGQTLPVSATVVEGAEYERLWAVLTTENPNYERYRSRTARAIPIVRLHHRGASQPRP
ncbi:MAG: nitroreductase family deazaflavin-dependent oxidoreductase [Chloroflexia bacterium]|nr:nitroreductase family deazaflavin-dependent oxidoreductase [Chloroflexia bacterium]